MWSSIFVNQWPVPAGNDDDVAGLEVVGDAVADLGAVVARPVELDDGPQRGGTPLPVGDVGPEHERRRSRDDVIDLADLIVFGD